MGFATVAAITSCGTTDSTASPVAPTVVPLEVGDHFVEVAQFGEGRAVAATSQDGSDVIIATTVGVTIPDSSQLIETELALPLGEVTVSSTGRSALLTSAGDAELWALGDQPSLLSTLTDVGSAVFTDDGAQLLVAAPTGLRRLSTADGSTVTTTALPDGAAARIVAWDTASGAAFVLANDETMPNAWMWTSDGQLDPAAIGDASSVVRAEFDPPRGRVILGTTGDGGRLDGHLRAWDVAAAQDAWSVGFRSDLAAPTWAVGADGRVLVTRGLDGELLDVDGTTVSSWTLEVPADAPEGRDLNISLGGSESVASVVALHRSDGYAIVRSRGAVSLVDADGRMTTEMPSSGSTLIGIDEFTGSPGIVTVDYHGLVRTWAGDGTMISETDDFMAGGINEVTVSPNGELFAFVTSEGNAAVVEVGDLDPLTQRGITPLPRTFEQPEGNLDTVQFAPDGSMVITGVSEPNGELSFDNTLSRWELGGTDRSFVIGGVVRRIMGCVAFRNTVRFTPDGESFVSPFHDFSVSLRSSDDGTVIHRFEPHLSTVLDLAVSPDGKSLVTASDDWTMRVWDLDDYGLKSKFEIAPGGYLTIDYLPDGSSLIVSDVAGRLRIFDMTDGSLSEPFDGTIAPGSRLALAPDGEHVAGGLSDGRIAIWNVASGDVVDEFGGHAAAVDAVAFTPDGTAIVSGSLDGTVKIWAVAARS